MPRFARVVVPGLPHHVTHRGNRKLDIFVDDTDRHVYLRMLRDQLQKHEVLIWAYCMMRNHIHNIVVPEKEDALSCVFQSAHGEYAQYFNARYGKTGHLWESRFHSSVLDESYLWNAVRYVERNPVRAGLVTRAEEFPWSSAAAHCGQRADKLLSPDLPLLDVISDWSAWLERKEQPEILQRIRQKTSTGRPCGSDDFVRVLETKLGRTLLPQKTGRKPSEGK